MQTQRLHKIAQRQSHVFTYQYAQPNDYKFCLDSVIFAQLVADEIRAQAQATWRVLDVCAGCGVIGLELSHHLPTLQKIDFLEIQNEFRASFTENLQITAKSKNDFCFLNYSFTELKKPHFHETYDLIIGNPPYFYPQDGRLTASPFKNHCRFFLDSNLAALSRSVTNALKSQGQAYLLVKSGQIHGHDHLHELRQGCDDQARLTVIADIRGTLVAKITKV